MQSIFFHISSLNNYGSSNKNYKKQKRNVLNGRTPQNKTGKSEMENKTGDRGLKEAVRMQEGNID